LGSGFRVWWRVAATTRPFTNVQLASEIAERIRLTATEIRLGDRTLTVSIGVAACSADTTSAEALVAKADHALYRAEKAGKNCVKTGA